MAMPFLDGPTMRKLLAHGPFDALRAAGLLEQLGVAVGAIHSAGIVHRDLKPENVIVLRAGSVDEQTVVIDFGSSAARGPESMMEETTTLTGSMHYLAPERLAGHYSPASDVYSLSVMALEMLTGKRPAEMDVSPAEAAFASALRDFCGDDAAASIASALRHQPAKRPAEVSRWTEHLAQSLREFSATHPNGPPSN